MNLLLGEGQLGELVIVLLAVQPWHQLPVLSPITDKTIPSVSTIHCIAGSRYLIIRGFNFEGNNSSEII